MTAPEPAPPAASPVAVGWRHLPLGLQLGVLLVALALVGFVLSRRLADRQADRERVAAERADRLAAALLAATEMGAAMLDMESGERGYLLTADPSFLEPYERGRRRFAQQVARIARDTVAAAPATLRPFRDTRVLVARWRTEMAEPAIARVAADPSAARRGDPAVHLLSGRRLMDSARVAHGALLQALRAEAFAAQAQRVDDDVAARREDTALQVLLLVLGVAVFAAAAGVVRRNLDAIVVAGEALARGDRAAARLGTTGSSAELRRLAAAFDRVAEAIADRERELEGDLERLREVERLKSEFVSTVSHELRTPLTSIRGSLALVLAGSAGPVADKAAGLLRIAHQNTERLIRLINDILDVEKMASGHAPLRHDRVDLRTVLEMTLAGLEAYAFEHRVRTTLDGPPTAVVVGDADRLVQVYTNLVSNAIKFSPADGTVRVRFGDQDGEIVVRVHDDGPGIPPEFRPQIFHPFQQAPAPDGTRGGTGLGLAIARTIVEGHGGRITFESEPGRGTTFVTALPAAPAVAAAAEAPGGHWRVLIVDADESMGAVLASLVHPVAEAVAVASAEEGLAALRDGAFDAVVLDPALAGRSGFDLVRRARAADRTHDLPVLLFTASEPSPDELEDLGIAPSHVFIKARHPEEQLLRRLRAVLEARRP